MGFGYAVRASLTMLRHPWQGVERIRGRIDRRRDKRKLSALGVRISDLYEAVADWQPRLHGALAVRGCGSVRSGVGPPGR
jgi:hypothetical protein